MAEETKKLVADTELKALVETDPDFAEERVVLQNSASSEQQILVARASIAHKYQLWKLRQEDPEYAKAVEILNERIGPTSSSPDEVDKATRIVKWKKHKDTPKETTAQLDISLSLGAHYPGAVYDYWKCYWGRDTVPCTVVLESKSRTDGHLIIKRDDKVCVKCPIDALDITIPFNKQMCLYSLEGLPIGLVFATETQAYDWYDMLSACNAGHDYPMHTSDWNLEGRLLRRQRRHNRDELNL